MSAQETARAGLLSQNQKLTVVPISRAEANAYVDAHHRHNGRLPSMKYHCALIDETGRVRGVGIAGLPKAKALCARTTIEISRVCTDGAPNGCSMLYGALIRACRALGYRRIITYTLESEPGGSLRAVGFVPVSRWDGGSWAEMRGTGSSGEYDTGPKIRWELNHGDHVEKIDFGLPELVSHPSLFSDEVA